MSIERHPLFIRPKLELCREIELLRAKLANLKALLKDICDEWSEDCDPGCDSMAHTEHCKAQNIAEAKRAMREENERLRAELANKDQILGDTLAVLCGDGGHYRAEHGDIKAKEHGLKRYHDLLVSEDGLRAELAVERKRQSAMRTLIASQEGTLSHYRSKQAEADEAVRTLDSERQANATLTAELSECKADAERYHWIKQCALFGITKRQDIVLTLPIYAANHIGELDAGIDASRKGEGE